MMPDFTRTNSAEIHNIGHYFLRIIMMFTIVCQGAYKYVPGTTLIDLGTNLKEPRKPVDMTFIFCSRGAGYIVGSMIGTLMCHWLLHSTAKPLLISLDAFVFSVLIYGTSWSMNRSYEGLLLTFAAGGVVLGVLDIGTHIICIHFLKFFRNFYVSLCLCHALGGFISPVLAINFLSSYKNISSLLSDDITTDWEFYHQRYVFYTYNVISGGMFIACLLWFAYFCFSGEEERCEETDVKEDRHILIMTMLGILAAAVITFFSEMLVFSFATILPVLSLKNFPKEKAKHTTGLATELTTAVHLSMLFLGFVVLGRFGVLIVTAKKVPASITLVIAAFAMFCGIFIFYLCGEQDWVFFCIGCALLGLSSGSISPVVYYWLNHKVTLTYRNMNPLFLMDSFAELVGPWYLSRILWDQPGGIRYFATIVAVIIFLVLILQFFLLRNLPEECSNTDPCGTVSSAGGIDAMQQEYLNRRTQRQDEGYEQIGRKAFPHVRADDIFKNISEVHDRVKKGTKDAKGAFNILNYSKDS